MEAEGFMAFSQPFPAMVLIGGVLVLTADL